MIFIWQAIRIQASFSQPSGNEKMYKLDYGRTNFGNLTAITNNGYGFWGPPVRTEIAPEMVVLELRGK